MYGILVGILILDALILIIAVLLQAGQGGGLATMGGGAGTETIMGGRQATTLLTKATWWTAGIFLFLSLILTFMSAGGRSQVRSVLEDQGQAPTPVAPTPLPIETQPTAPPPAPRPQPQPNRRP
jgi:preprotein translocase subunit SecG